MNEPIRLGDILFSGHRMGDWSSDDLHRALAVAWYCSTPPFQLVPPPPRRLLDSDDPGHATRRECGDHAPDAGP